MSERRRIGTRPIQVELAKLRMRELSLSPLTIARASVSAGNLRLSARTLQRMLSGEPVSREKREALAHALNLSIHELEATEPVPFFGPGTRHSPGGSLPGSPDRTSDAAKARSRFRDFLGTQGHASTADLARRYGNQLLAMQNPDGGWGSEPGVASSPLNTAEVLLALHYRAAEETQAVRRGIEFLRDSQEADGGWVSRRQLLREEITVTATARCVQALQAHATVTAADELEKPVRQAFAYLLDTGKGDLWSNSPGAPPSILATAFALQAFACLPQSADAGGGHAVLESALDRMSQAQTQDGGFPYTPGQPSSVAASLESMHAFLLLPQRRVPPDMLGRVHGFVDRLEPLRVAQTELQENDAIQGHGLQFEHFNAASLLIVSEHRGLFDGSLLRTCLEQMAQFMRSDGCAATVGGRLYSWSTAHCIRALLATPQSIKDEDMRNSPDAR